MTRCITESSEHCEIIPHPNSGSLQKPASLLHWLMCDVWFSDHPGKATNFHLKTIAFTSVTNVYQFSGIACIAIVLQPNWSGKTTDFEAERAINWCRKKRATDLNSPQCIVDTPSPLLTHITKQFGCFWTQSVGVSRKTCAGSWRSRQTHVAFPITNYAAYTSLRMPLHFQRWTTINHESGFTRAIIEKLAS